LSDKRCMETRSVNGDPYDCVHCQGHQGMHEFLIGGKLISGDLSANDFDRISSLTDNGPRSFCQYNLTLPEDLGIRLMKLLAVIAEATGAPLPMKREKRWEQIADSTELVVKLCEGISIETWRKI
jgi:hypothetical protein